MIKYVQKQIEEIRNNRALYWFGLFLTFTHFVTWYNWGPQMNKLLRIFTARTPICWPYFPDCFVFRPLDPSWAYSIGIGYLAIAVVTLLFWALKKIKLFWWSLLLMTLFKWVVLSLDYTLMGNYHYMQLILILVYLLASSKIRFVSLFLVSFYVGAGLLKFNSEWYSGSALIQDSYFRGKILEWSLIYVIYLELFLVWGVLSSNRFIRWGTWLQLVAFHIYSWHIVGYYYPVTMFGLIAFFPIYWLLEKRSFHFANLPWSKSGLLFLSLFWIAQLIPAVFYKKSALTGQGRILSLNMLDAWTVCNNTMVVKLNKQSLMVILPVPKNYGIRIQCDPILYVSHLREECDKWKANPDFQDIDFSLRSRFRTDEESTEVMNVKNVCSHPPQLSILGGVYQ